MLLIVVMLAALAVVVVMGLVLLAYGVARPPRMTDGKAVYVLNRLSPGDLGLRYEVQSFTVRDEQSGQPLKIAAWWIPHPAGGQKTVIFIHGYADAKVGSIAWAPTWQTLGWNILAIDLRAHGESGGKFTTAGVFEQHDLDQVINQLRATRPQQTGHLALLGISLGASVALMTAHRRDDIDAVVLECPFPTFRDAVKAHLRVFALPLETLSPIVFRIATWITGADMSQAEPRELLARVICPVMVIQSGDDLFVSQEQAQQIESALEARPAEAGQATHWLIPGAPHLFGLTVDPDEYIRRVGDFLSNCSTGVAHTPASDIS
jgi:pimeloyl-ACP methyl ester carboxylesterase